MNYFNFFSQYSGNRQTSGDGKKILLAVSLAAILLCTGIYGFNVFRCIRYQSQLNYLNEIKTNPIFIEQHAVATKVSARIGGAEKELGFMQRLGPYADVVSTLNTGLMDLIDQCVIDGAYLSTLDLDGIDLGLTGYAADLTAITTIERNFRNSGKFSNVLMRTIENDTQSTNMISFSCQMKLDGGAILDEQN